MENDNATDEEFTDIFIKTGRVQYIVMALILSGFILYGKEFINIMWVGPEYSESYIIASILMIPSIVPLIQNVGLNILQAKNKYKFRVIILMVFAIVNIIISIYLSKIYGGIGAALGTAISTILGTVISMNIFYYKKVGINIIEFWRNIIKMSIPMIFVIIFAVIVKMILPINNEIILIAQIIFYALVYCFVIYKFSINEYEKQLILKPLNKIFGRKQNA